MSKTAPSCPCVAQHSPKPAYLQKHHIVPKSWGGLSTPDNLASICGTTHDAAHDAMNRLVKAQRETGLSGYPRYARELALRAVRAYVAANGHWPHTYTLAQPGDHHDA